MLFEIFFSYKGQLCTLHSFGFSWEIREKIFSVFPGAEILLFAHVGINGI